MSGPKRLTDQTQQVLSLAHQQAIRLNHTYVGSEHLLFAIMQGGSETANKVLKNHGITMEAVQTTFENMGGKGQQPLPDIKVEMSALANQIILLAITETRRLEHTQVQPEHLLVAILQHRTCRASRILQILGHYPEAIETELVKIMRENPDG